MKVLALDPGYDRLGVAVLSGNGSAPILLYSTCITTDKQKALPDRIYELGIALEAVIKEYAPDTLALEKLFFNQNVSTGIAVAEVRGVALYLMKKHGAFIMEFSPQEVKVAITGYGKSDKKAVALMVKRLLPSAPREAVDDEYDAIAVGITALAHHRA